MTEDTYTLGFARCSTKIQDADYEKNALIKYGVKPENIFIEYESGSKTKDDRPIFNSLLEKLKSKPKSTLVVTDLTRICRNRSDVNYLISFIDKYKLRLIVTTSDNFIIDCRSEELAFVAGLLLYVLGYMGTYDLQVKHSQIRLGMQNARDKGIRLGRPRITKENIDDNFYRFYYLYKSGKISISELSRVSGKCRNTVYSYIKIIEKEN